MMQLKAADTIRGLILLDKIKVLEKGGGGPLNSDVTVATRCMSRLASESKMNLWLGRITI
jgi:hypothetical protein